MGRYKSYQGLDKRQAIERAKQDVQNKIYEELTRRGLACTHIGNDLSINNYSLFCAGYPLDVDEIADKIRLRIKYDSRTIKWAGQIRGNLQLSTTFVLGPKFQLEKVCDTIQLILKDREEIKKQEQKRQLSDNNKAVNVDKAEELLKELELPKDSRLSVRVTDDLTKPFNVKVNFWGLNKFQVLALYGVLQESGLLDTPKEPT